MKDYCSRVQRHSHAWSCPSDRKGHDGLGSKPAHRESHPAVVAGSLFSRTFRDQRPTHNKRDSKRETEIERDGPKSEQGKPEGCHESEEPMWPSTDYPNARPPTESKEQSKGFPGERL